MVELGITVGKMSIFIKLEKGHGALEKYSI